ncbi:MAG: DUF1254 domain-containing protein [Arenicella sp.]|nr:DUF1254 domain-containing protein [Arenicella sp.]
MQIQERVAQGQENWAFSVGVQAYIWGLPIIKCWNDRLEKMKMPAAEHSANADHFIVNNFRHDRSLASGDSTEFVNAATDFLYSLAVIDLSNGPLHLTSPDFQGRWYGLQLLDPYMNTVANFGTRQFGDQLPSIIIATSGQDVSAYDSHHIVHGESPYLYIVGRIAADINEDLSAVHSLQNDLKFERVSGDAPLTAPAKDSWLPLKPTDSGCPPELLFFETLGQVLKFVPPKDGELALEQLFKEIGLTVENGFEYSALSEPMRIGLAKSATFAQSILDDKIYEVGELINGWSLVRDVGEYHGNYIVRALVSIHGIWANVPDEALYFMARTDSEGNLLNGNNRYEVRFAKKATPPVDAFWSICYYDDQGRLVQNRQKRHAINSLYSRLLSNEDDSISILIGPESNPSVLGKSKMSENCLPSHNGNFNLNLRCYNPKEELLSGEYELPSIVKLA